MLDHRWKKSSYSDGGGNCVEARLSDDGGGVEVRHSKTPELGSIKFTASEWEAFVAGAKDGQFGIPE